MTRSKIEWTERRWNPIVGCSVVSPGCTNCYAMTMARRIEAIHAALPPSRRDAREYEGTTQVVNGKAVWTGKVALAGDDKLMQPLRRRKSATYFVNSMGDLFHEAVPEEWIDRVFAVMALSPQHTFQVLTKRAERMRAYVSKIASDRSEYLTWRMQCSFLLRDLDRSRDATGPGPSWPLRNVWLGVSAEDQRRADERIPDLLATPAAVRFVSAEPLLGPIDLREYLYAFACHDCFNGRTRVTGHFFNERCPSCGGTGVEKPRLDLVIVGGESGVDARPMHPDWARSPRDQCAAANVPFFFKQWGNWRPEIDRDRDDPDWRQPYSQYREPAFQILNLAGGCGFHGERVHVMRRCTKKSAFRLLDGVEHNGMPGR